MNLYYKLWADALNRAKNNKNSEKGWKFRGLILISMMNALNYFSVGIWLKHFNIFEIPFYEVDITRVSMIDETLSFGLNFLSFFVIINYFLVFYNKKYKELLEKEPLKKSIAIPYAMISLGVGFGSAIAYGLLTGQGFS